MYTRDDRGLWCSNCIDGAPTPCTISYCDDGAHDQDGSESSSGDAYESPDAADSAG